jgi:small subunit ribosomal protein S18
MATYKGRTCFFVENNIQYIDYKNVALLEKFMTKYCKITPRYYSGASLKHQKKLSKAIKNARYMALIPYTAQ